MSLTPEFECPVCFNNILIITQICLKLLYKPVTTSCGHNFCKYCIDKTIMVTEKCPICRLPLSTEYSPNLLLTQIINERFPDEIDERSHQFDMIHEDNKMNINVGLDEDLDYLPLYFMNYYSPPSNGSKIIIANRIFNKIRPVATLIQIKSKSIGSYSFNNERYPNPIEGIAIERVELVLPPVKTNFDFYICRYKIFDDDCESYNIQNDITSLTSQRQIEIRNKLNHMIDSLAILTSNPRMFFQDLIQVKINSRLFGAQNKYLFCILLVNGSLTLIKKKLIKSPNSLKSRFTNLYGDLPMPIDHTCGIDNIVKLSLYLSRITSTTNGNKWHSFSCNDTLERLFKVIEIITLSWDSNFINLGEQKFFTSLFTSIDQLTSGILFLLAIIIIPMIYIYSKR